jgi:hypothetical protein
MVILAALSTVSCKKSYNCVCTMIEPGEANVAVTTVVNDTKYRASEACTNLSSSIKGFALTTCQIQ